ncbi:MAG: radical SAM protein [Desulfobacterales bacterium]|nr:radical SAM protein [Desulfobacterales bacterium]
MCENLPGVGAGEDRKRHHHQPVFMQWLRFMHGGMSRQQPWNFWVKNGMFMIWPANWSKTARILNQSGGGVTLSGGEAALQNDFCLSLLKELKGRGIQTALDTCGQVSQSVLASLLPYVDILLYDIKEIDSEKHKKFTGAGNEKILANAIFAANYKKTHRYPKTFWIRTPVIPGATDTAENIRGIGDFISANLRGSSSQMGTLRL